MKNRRLAITALLLLVVVVLGIGYATFVDTLVVRGTAKANSNDAAVAFEQDVYFTEATITLGSNDTSVDNAKVTDDNDIATLTAGSLATDGDKVSAMYTIINESDDLAARITEVAANNSDLTNFSVSYYFAGTTNAVSGTDTITVPAGGTVYLYVTVELLNTPTHIDDGEGNLTPVEWTSQFDFTINVVSEDS